MAGLTRILHHPNGQPFCITECHQAEGWLQTTWLGHVSHADAERGALAALEPLCQGPVAGLLNDNSQLKGPWFDSTAWLRRVWAPQAARLGLRYIAHVAQPHTEAELGAPLNSDLFELSIDLQVFTNSEEAIDWLRDCLHQATPAGPAASAQPQPATATMA